MTARLRVALDVGVDPGALGGIEQHLVALVQALTDHQPAGAELLVADSSSDPMWLSRYLTAPPPMICRQRPRVAITERLDAAVRPVRRVAGHFLRGARRAAGLPVHVMGEPLPYVDPFFDELDADVVHFPYPPHFRLGRTPSVLTMHDLQHRHFPEAFSAEHLAWREAAYPVALQAARLIVTGSDWARLDIARQYQIDLEKIVAIHHTPPTAHYAPVSPDMLGQARRRFRADVPFALFPALTYRHKNHVRLLEAVALLRDRDGLALRVICPGRQALYWPEIESRRRELGLADQVVFPGFIAADQLRALYHLASFVVFPTLFEGAGLPALEAIAEGAPLACADLPALREYAADAALYFEPRSVEDIALAMRRLWSDEDLRQELRERGRRQALTFAPRAAAAAYWKVYEAAARPAAVDERGPTAPKERHVVIAH